MCSIKKLFTLLNSLQCFILNIYSIHSCCIIVVMIKQKYLKVIEVIGIFYCKLGKKIYFTYNLINNLIILV